MCHHEDIEMAFNTWLQKITFMRCSLTTTEEKNILGMYVSIHALEHPDLYEKLINITNKQLRSRQFKDLASNSIKGITTTNDHATSTKGKAPQPRVTLNPTIIKDLPENPTDSFQIYSTGIKLSSIFKFMLGVISGTGIACAFLLSHLFFILFGLGVLGYALIIENERAKKIH